MRHVQDTHNTEETFTRMESCYSYFIRFFLGLVKTLHFVRRLVMCIELCCSLRCCFSFLCVAFPPSFLLSLALHPPTRKGSVQRGRSACLRLPQQQQQLNVEYTEYWMGPCLSKFSSPFSLFCFAPFIFPSYSFLSFLLNRIVFNSFEWQKRSSHGQLFFFLLSALRSFLAASLWE